MERLAAAVERGAADKGPPVEEDNPSGSEGEGVRHARVHAVIHARGGRTGY